jgi:nicotinamidase/pyrazinamidase
MGGETKPARYREVVAAVTYDEKIALLVVDVQNDFADPNGSLSVAGAEAVIPIINEEIEAARSAGSPIFYTQDWHPPDTPHFATHGGPWPVHCVRDTWGAQLHPDLIVAGPSVHKATGHEDGYSGFTTRHTKTGEYYPTGLDALLREAGVARVVVVGLALDYCVKHTALDALRLGYPEVIVPRAATAPVEVSPGDGARAEAEIAAAGAKVIQAGPVR